MTTVNKFHEEFVRLRDEYLSVKDDFQGKERANAPQFNIFRFLRLMEVRHSAFLAELLDPRGTHGQGDLFLRHFMNYCAQKYGNDTGKTFTFTEGTDDQWQLMTERVVTPYGRLDILIENPELGVLIVIENKFGANEGEYQLKAYSDWLGTQEEDYPHRALLYLTPDGNASARLDPARYYRFSYKHDVATWLEEAVGEVKANRIEATIAQYLDLIREEKVRGLSEFEELLRRPENLEPAMNVARELEGLRDKLHARFWMAVEQEMSQRLEGTEYAPEWEIQGPQGDHRQAWLNCSIMPRSDLYDLKRPYASISLEQHRPQSKYRLHYGIAWHGDLEHPDHLPEYQALYQYLVAQQWHPRQGHWIWGTEVGFSPVGDRFLLRIGLDEETFVREIVDLPWNLFTDTVGLLSALNRTLRHASA